MFLWKVQLSKVEHNRPNFFNLQTRSCFVKPSLITSALPFPRNLYFQIGFYVKK